MNKDRYNIHYRAAETSRIMDWIKAGRSGCLIGLRGAAKSNLVRFMLRADVQQHYLGANHAQHTLILIDMLALTEYAAWAVYERILDRMLAQIDLFAPQRAAELSERYRQVIATRDPLVGRRVLERCIDDVCQQSGQRLVLFLDEFDRPFRVLDPSLFRCLRAIRDAHKDRVSYIVVVTEALSRQRDNLAEVEHFYRLVARNVCGVGPYNQQDARQMIYYLAARQEIELDPDTTAQLIERSGGHAGLLKVMLSQLWTAPPTASLAEQIPPLEKNPALQAECRKVWDSLADDRQAALCGLASGAAVDPQSLHQLRQMGLVREHESGYTIFSPLFAHFVRQQEPAAASVQVDRATHQVQLGERRIETLSELEFELLCYLYQHQGQVCTKDDLIANVYRQRYDSMVGGVSDQALQTLVARLRAKVEPDSSHPRYIRTVRGQGYTLIMPEIDQGDARDA